RARLVPAVRKPVVLPGRPDADGAALGVGGQSGHIRHRLPARRRDLRIRVDVHRRGRAAGGRGRAVRRDRRGTEPPRRRTLTSRTPEPGLTDGRQPRPELLGLFSVKNPYCSIDPYGYRSLWIDYATPGPAHPTWLEGLPDMKTLRTLLAVGASACVVGAAILVTAAAYAAGVTATVVKTSSWDTGFEGKVTITNGGPAISSWTVAFDLAGGTISSSWDSVRTDSGTHHSFANAGWNGSIPSGGTASFGFVATGSGTPGNCTVNGGACGGGGGGPDT